jgi:hypothetical protein
MNRFPIPVLPAPSTVLSGRFRVLAESSRPAGSSTAKTSASGWGPQSPEAGFAYEAAAAEARQRHLFSDALAGTAF